MANSLDPRAARSRAAILIAARALLLEQGPAAITHQRVAEKAGVGRATVYRHWPQSEELLRDVMTDVDMPYFHDPEVPVRPWLHAQLRKLGEELSTPEIAGILLTLMQSALRDPYVTMQRDECFDALANRLETALQLAVGNGEVSLFDGPLDLASLLLGPVIYRAAMQAGSVTAELVDRSIDSLGTWEKGAAHDVDQRRV